MTKMSCTKAHLMKFYIAKDKKFKKKKKADHIPNVKSENDFSAATLETGI